MNWDTDCTVLPRSNAHFFVFMIGVSPTAFSSTSTKKKDKMMWKIFKWWQRHTDCTREFSNTLLTYYKLHTCNITKLVGHHKDSLCSVGTVYYSVGKICFLYIEFKNWLNACEYRNEKIDTFSESCLVLMLCHYKKIRTLMPVIKSPYYLHLSKMKVWRRKKSIIYNYGENLVHAE